MKESRCPRSGALLFTPSKEDKEKLNESRKIVILEKKNKSLERKLKKLESLVNKFIKE